jgi:hypothetical protein
VQGNSGSLKIYADSGKVDNNALNFGTLGTRGTAERLEHVEHPEQIRSGEHLSQP